MILKEIGRKIAQAFRSVKAADEKVASSIAATLDAKVEQLKEYEKSFEPPEPEPMQQVIQSLAAYGLSADEAACSIAKALSQKPEPLRHLTNNWRKMHGLPMHRKPAAFRRRRKKLNER